jgi:hypothetical protein
VLPGMHLCSQVSLSHDSPLPVNWIRPHPEVIIGDGGFGTMQARIPQPAGEIVITRHRLIELLDKLDDLIGGCRAQPDGDPG